MKATSVGLFGLCLAAVASLTQPAVAQWPVYGIMAVKNANTGGPVNLATVRNDYGDSATDWNGQFWALMYPSEHFVANANGYYQTDKYLTLAEANSAYAEIYMPPVPPTTVGQEHLIVAAPLLGFCFAAAGFRKKRTAVA